MFLNCLKYEYYITTACIWEPGKKYTSDIVPSFSIDDFFPSRYNTCKFKIKNTLSEYYLYYGTSTNGPCVNLGNHVSVVDTDRSISSMPYVLFPVRDTYSCTHSPLHITMANKPVAM